MSAQFDPASLTIGDAEDMLRHIRAFSLPTAVNPYFDNPWPRYQQWRSTAQYLALCELCDRLFDAEFSEDCLQKIKRRLARWLGRLSNEVGSVLVDDALGILAKDVDDDAAPAGPAALGGIGPPGRPARGRRRSDPVAPGDRGPARSDRGGPDWAAGRRIGRLGEG
jgi:hypothetical protein